MSHNSLFVEGRKASFQGLQASIDSAVLCFSWCERRNEKVLEGQRNRVMLSHQVQYHIVIQLCTTVHCAPELAQNQRLDKVWSWVLIRSKVAYISWISTRLETRLALTRFANLNLWPRSFVWHGHKSHTVKQQTQLSHSSFTRTALVPCHNLYLISWAQQIE